MLKKLAKLDILVQFYRMKTAYEIEKDFSTDKYFVKSKLYKYYFSWEVMTQIRKGLFSYPRVEQLESWYADLDMFTRKKIKKEKL